MESIFVKGMYVLQTGSLVLGQMVLNIGGGFGVGGAGACALCSCFNKCLSEVKHGTSMEWCKM